MTAKEVLSTEILPGDIGWKTLSANWLFHQGVSTVLLLLICLALWRGIPYVIEQYLSGLADQRVFYKERMDDYQERNTLQRQEFLKSMETYRDLSMQERKELREERQTFVKLLQELNQSLKTLH
jgi:hypothetical protein